MPNKQTDKEKNGAQIVYVDSCQLPMPFAVFTMHGFFDKAAGKEHVALTLGDVADGQPVLARVHSECLTGDALFSQKCDCGAQLSAALHKIAEEGRGVLLYLRQEGRGIGLLNKIRAYHLQDEGADTVEANERLGFPPDLRRYDLCVPMLDHLGVHSLKLMTNNPEKIEALTQHGIIVTERVPIIVNKNPYNIGYLGIKAQKMRHMIPLDEE